jgi:hypothetical protein
MFKQVCIFFLLLLSFYNGFGQKKFAVVKDLQSDWTVFRDGSYQKIEDEKFSGAESIHFTIHAAAYPNTKLLLRSPKDYYLFINGLLVTKHNHDVRLSVDSLSGKFGKVLNLSVYQKGLTEAHLKTFLISNRAPDEDPLFKPRPHVRDFASLSGLLLIVFFAALITVNPKLTTDYFSLIKVLSMREAEDNQPHARFVIGSNVWFYIFCSLLTALYLMIVFTHLPESYSLAKDAGTLTFGVLLWQWVKLSFLVLAIVITKGLIIFLLSNLFGMGGIAGVHFLNFIRFALVLVSSLMVILFVYYISRGTNPFVYKIFLYALPFGLSAWILVLFFKLNNRIEHTMFHLFSYICATELIPLLLVMTVLFE